ncbi:hypothetical protein ACWC98_12060 [Streptomyces goshikiensis]
MPEAGRAGMPGIGHVTVVHTTGLWAAPDTGTKRFARLVAELLEVPTALVSVSTTAGSASLA